MENSVVLSVAVYLSVLTIGSTDDVEGKEKQQKKPLVLSGLAVLGGEVGAVEELRRRRIR